MADDDKNERVGLFDVIWDTDTELGRQASAEMERQYRNGQMSVETNDE